MSNTTSADTAAAAAATRSSRETPSLLQQLTLNVNKTFRDCDSHDATRSTAAAAAAAERDGDHADPSPTAATLEPPSSVRRVLTKNAEPKHNGGLDNADRNLIVRVRDVLGGKDALPSQPDWVVLDLLGQGTFGQVFRCQHAETKEIVAVKVIRNHPSYYKQALVEVQLTNLLNRSYSEREAPHIVRLLDTFEFRHHLCLVFELLSLNVYELIAENNFNGFPLEVTRGFLQQILHAMIQMEDTGVIHCDLKPENILLVGQDRFLKDVQYDDHDVAASAAAASASTAAQTPFVKVVDFGSACLENETVYSYIQSRFYRSPEVLLGIPYTGAIDVWSLGCIAVEMFLGLPLFPGVSEHDQLRLIEETLGRLPQDLLRRGRHVLKFYNVRDDCELVLKTPSEYARENDAEVQVSKKYFKHSRLRDMVHAYPYSTDSSAAQRDAERQQRDAFLDLVRQLLAPDPEQRCTARDALVHPFLSGQSSALGDKQRGTDASPRPNAVAPFPSSSDADRFDSSAADAATGAYAAYGAAFCPAAAAATTTAAAAYAIWPYTFGPVREGSHVWGYPSGSAAQLLTPSLFFPTDRARVNAEVLSSSGGSHSHVLPVPVPAFPLTHQAAVMPVYTSMYPVAAPVLSDVYRAPTHYSKVAPLVPSSGEARAAAVVPMAETPSADGNWGAATQHWQWQEDRYGCHGWPYPSQSQSQLEAPSKRSSSHAAPEPPHHGSTRRPHRRQPAPTQAPRDHAHSAKSRGRKDGKTTATRSNDGGAKRHRLEQRSSTDATHNEQTVCAVEENKQRAAIALAPASSAVSLPT